MSTQTKRLDALATVLRSEYLTAREIARRFKCCKPTAYARIAALKARGESVFEYVDPRGNTGPSPTRYGVAPGPS